MLHVRRTFETYVEKGPPFIAGLVILLTAFCVSHTPRPSLIGDPNLNRRKAEKPELSTLNRTPSDAQPPITLVKKTVDSFDEHQLAIPLDVLISSWKGSVVDPITYKLDGKFLEMLDIPRAEMDPLMATVQSLVAEIKSNQQTYSKRLDFAPGWLMVASAISDSQIMARLNESQLPAKRCVAARIQAMLGSEICKLNRTRMVRVIIDDDLDYVRVQESSLEEFETVLADSREIGTGASKTGSWFKDVFTHEYGHLYNIQEIYGH